MRQIKLKFEIGTPNIYNDLGCSPMLLKCFCGWLSSHKEDISTLEIALYLFNNEILYSTLKDLADKGCQIHIYSIPLEGYDDDKPIKITNHQNSLSLGIRTKFYFASRIYTDIQKSNHPNLHLHIVPHMYLRSDNVHAFSRGNMPYSLHCKTFFLRYKNGSAFAGLTSSNMAVRDAQKIEMAYVTSLSQQEITSASDFFAGLKENSILVADFDPSADYNHFRIVKRPAPPASKILYTAPFYEDSASIFENRLATMIKRAKRRIVVCAQHICAYEYAYPWKFTSRPTEGSGMSKKDGFLKDVLNMANTGISTTFISQTYADSQGTHGCRSPENKTAFIKFVTAAQNTSNCYYYVNPYLHAKFLLIDDIVVATTCNFTPSQFIYLPDVNISSFKYIPNTSYSGIFCEFGAYFVERNQKLADGLAAKADVIIHHQETQRMF